MTEPDTPTTRPRRLLRRSLWLGGAALALSLGLGVVYGTSQGWSNAGDCAAAAPIAASLRPLAKGDVAAVQVASQPKPVPALSFTGPAGEPLTLEAFKGKTVLLNLWATWCAPCKHEMPALDALQAQLGGSDFQVVAVNIDTRNLDKPKQWLAETGIKSLAYYADPPAKTFQTLKLAGKAFGMPTTLLVDPKGCELATLAGPAEWGGADALALIKAALGR